MNPLLKGAFVALLATATLNAETIATVNGEKVTKEDVNIMLQQAKLPSYDSLKAEEKEKLLESMIDRKLMIQHAKKEGVEKNPDYKKAIELLSENVMIDIYLESYLSKIPATDAEAKKLYNENIERFKQAEQVHARHILVEKQSDAEALIKQVNAKPLNQRENTFSDLARSKSTDKGSGANGGDLGFFGKGQMVKEFEDAAFALKKGEMTKAPVKSAFGYHIIFVVDKKAAQTVPFEQVADQLKQNVKMQKFEENLEKLTSDLKAKAKITK